ncbi:unknown [Clostridium sp. CAG:590]|nr:unknown [Clostridium sp. CAG:590]
MKLQYVRAFIVLLAGLIALIINMCMGRPITLSLFIVLVVILIFYVIGTLVVEILEKGMDKFKRSESADVSDEPEEMNQQPEEQTVGNVHFDEDEEDE